ncbi:hypothetical protein X927_00545 [Petrotoga mexicana DSM 14811]|uniref:Uncharacterized protein n=1 Tax=Petrotoga mexicana DSM 14811 TaxID=1122954 RepID=A0A2K1PFL9_9BACT|nr:hypothetical protein [Petrotoga mexicana]PNS01582.1 hypothetical protein X927_00545 [Petrotoga mexicana DSM 14811]
MSRYNYLLKLVFAIVFGISALFIPSFFLKIIFSTVAIVFLALNLKSFKILFVILAVVLFVIPASIFSNFIGSQLDWDNLWSNIFNGEEFYNQNDYSYNSNTEEIQPDIYIERAENLQIEGINLEIIFDETSDQVYIPSQINHRRNGNTLTLTSHIKYQNFTPKVIIVIGSKVPYKNIRINSTGLNVEGNLEVENFDLNTTGLDFNVTLEASNLSINSTSLDIDGEIHVGNAEIDSTGTSWEGLVDAEELKLDSGSLSFDGDIHVGNAEIDATRINWEGLVDAEELKLDGTSMDIDLSVINAEHIYIDGTTLNGTIKYMDKWVGTRYLSIDRTSGELDILEPSDNEGRLDLDTQDRIEIRRKKY